VLSAFALVVLASAFGGGWLLRRSGRQRLGVLVAVSGVALVAIVVLAVLLVAATLCSGGC